MYTKEERIEMVNLYLCGNSLRAVRDLFSVKYSDRPIPCTETVRKTVEKFQSKGCVIDAHKKRSRINTVLTEEMKLNILCYVEEIPVVSVVNVAKHFGISSYSVHKTLKTFNYKPYKFSNHQVLYDEDKEKRTDFCELVFNMINENETILNRIIFTDEATFTLNGEVNSQNYRHWSHTNRNVQNLTRTQYPQKLNVWIGIVDAKLIGPFFIDGTLTSAKFLELLQNNVLPEMELLEIEEPWFQMDGAPAHSTGTITRFLNETFPGRWIGRYGPVRWPARSADLSPNDFFLWGYLKNNIYTHVQMNSLDELKQKIQTTCAEINPDFLKNTLRAFYNRLAYCLERQGGHFEHLL